LPRRIVVIAPNVCLGRIVVDFCGDAKRSRAVLLVAVNEKLVAAYFVQNLFQLQLVVKRAFGNELKLTTLAKNLGDKIVIQRLHLV